MKMQYPEILRSLGKFKFPWKFQPRFKIPWKIQSLVKAAMLGLVIGLVALIVLKPRVDSGFHTDYLANLNQMEALTGELHRDHLLVRQRLFERFQEPVFNLEHFTLP